MENFLLIFDIILAVLLIVTVLLQKSEGGALGLGVSQESFVSSRSAGSFLTKATAILAALFIITSISLTVVSKEKFSSSSVLEEIEEEEEIGEEHGRQIVPRPNLVRHVSDSDEKDEKPAASSRLLGEMRRLNVSYNPEAKSELDRLDGVTPRNSDSVRVNRIEVANIVREVTMESQNKKVPNPGVKPENQYAEPSTFEEAWNYPDPRQ